MMRNTTLAVLWFACALTSTFSFDLMSNKVPCHNYFKWDGEKNCQDRGCEWHPLAGCTFPAQGVPVETIHVVQGCHLDVGFIHSAPDIINEWFHQHFPRAHSVGKALKARNGTERLHFTAQSWLVSLFIDCPVDWEGIICPTSEELANFTEAVAEGWITWHAFPFNGEPEFADASLFSFGLNLTHTVDDALNVKRKTVMSQRDVPGMTRAVVPLLLSAGVDTVSVGVNGGSTPPNVPPVFRWRDPNGHEVRVLYNSGGYGGITINTKGVKFRTHIRVPGSADALVVDWRGDNAGPPGSTDEVLKDFADLRREFPKTNVIPSTFEQFASTLRGVSSEDLPVVTSEIGDTWVHGVASDPRKVSQAREINRVRTAYEREHGEALTDTRFRHFSRLVMKNVEHTWGVDQKKNIEPAKALHSNWTNAEFEVARHSPGYEALVESWNRQRRMGLQDPLRSASTLPLVPTINESWAWNPPTGEPDVSHYTSILPPDLQPIVCGNLTVDIDAESGAITRVSGNGVDWKGSLAQLEYRTYSAEEYTAFMVQYNFLGPLFALDDVDDFDKIGIGRAGAKSRTVTPTVVAVHVQHGTSTSHILVEMRMPRDVVESAGASAKVWLNITVPWAGTTLDLELRLVNKTATRLPEATFLRFNPRHGDDTAPLNLSLSKLGSWVDPLDVVNGGALHQHAVDDAGFRFSGHATLRVAPLDTAVVSVGRPTALPVPTHAAPDAAQGMAAVLHDNTWNTNYIMWYPFNDDERDVSSRYRVYLDGSAPSPMN